jgi:hypothetical protein
MRLTLSDKSTLPRDTPFYERIVQDFTWKHYTRIITERLVPLIPQQKAITEITIMHTVKACAMQSEIGTSNYTTRKCQLIHKPSHETIARGAGPFGSRCTDRQTVLLWCFSGNMQPPAITNRPKATVCPKFERKGNLQLSRPFLYSLS